MATGVYIVKNHVLSLPDDPFLDSMELYIGSGVWIILCASIIQLFTESRWSKYVNQKQKEGKTT